MNTDVTFFAAPPITFGINQVFDQAFDSGWVQFPGHYLLYASTGAFQLEVGNVRWLLPPQRAAWVAAGTPLRLTGAGCFCRIDIGARNVALHHALGYGSRASTR